MSVNAAPVDRIGWPRVVASGALWTVVYNFVWGVAWFTFMQREWMDALAAMGRPMIWTAEVWFVWVVITFLLGVAIAAHAAPHAHAPLKSSLYPAAVVWLMFAAGMAVWSLVESFPVGLITIDSAVNLVGMLAASLACGWSLRSAPENS